MQAVGQSHDVYRLVVEPHIADAIWAILIAIACALVMLIDEMLKRRNAAQPSPRHRPRKPGRKR